MTRPRRTSPKPVIYLLAEDQTGYFVFQAIVRERKINAIVRLRGAAEGVSLLANEVEELILLILKEKSSKDCIVVLHDTDDSVQPYREDYDKIVRICEKYKDHVTRLEAIQEIESWLLADEGLCKWLDVKPKASDSLKRPSDQLKTLVKARPGNWKWDKKHQPRILENMSANGDRLSESMRLAIQTLLQLPCTQAK
ncbi:MAG: hypothetical protein ACYDBJ_27090 [Aggregatilineales bacterium]